MALKNRKVWLTACVVIASSLISSSSSRAASQTSQVKLSPPFIVVDLDGTGIKTIPLKDSKVYTDVDGDGFAEHTEWITPNEALLGIMTRSERQEQNSIKRFSTIYKNGIQKLLTHDKNKDGKYDEADYLPYIYTNESNAKRIRELAFFIAKDEDLSGMPDSKQSELLKCDFKSLDYKIDQSGMASGTIYCADKSYNFKEVRFHYEDSNVLWRPMCKQLRSSPTEAEDYQKKCLDKGFDPQNRGVWP